jgi:hypothetical protein
MDLWSPQSYETKLNYYDRVLHEYLGFDRLRILVSQDKDDNWGMILNAQESFPSKPSTIHAYILSISCEGIHLPSLF